jgi:predicted RNA-binding protein YlqC (UPF0109 family)
MTDAEPGDDHVDADDGNRVVGAQARAVAEYLARALVEDPDGVTVDVDERRGSVNIEIHVAPGDMGRIIGRRGRVVQAVRAVVRAAAAREGTDARVDVVD